MSYEPKILLLEIYTMNHYINSSEDMYINDHRQPICNNQLIDKAQMYVNSRMYEESVIYLNNETLCSNENEQTININNK